jgi:hypothetical protein
MDEERNVGGLASSEEWLVIVGEQTGMGEMESKPAPSEN